MVHRLGIALAQLGTCSCLAVSTTSVSLVISNWTLAPGGGASDRNPSHSGRTASQSAFWNAQRGLRTIHLREGVILVVSRIGRWSLPGVSSRTNTSHRPPSKGSAADHRVECRDAARVVARVGGSLGVWWSPFLAVEAVCKMLSDVFRRVKPMVPEWVMGIEVAQADCALTDRQGARVAEALALAILAQRMGGWFTSMMERSVLTRMRTPQTLVMSSAGATGRSLGGGGNPPGTCFAVAPFVAAATMVLTRSVRL